MRGLTVLMLASLAASSPAFAQDDAALNSADSAGVQQTILGQIDAFRHDDAARAFAFAAPVTQQRFGDPNVFLDMVRRAYQPVYNPHGIDFTKLSTQDGAIVQSVELIGPDGAAYTALYTMEREADGSWRIIACMLVPSQRVGA
jgi:ketosteroid isomerase-like protein